MNKSEATANKIVLASWFQNEILSIFLVNVLMKS